jgi:formylglycine-generating enzyme required for sulfatase activity
VAYAGASSTLRSGDTVLAGKTLPAELWTCASTANDGSASGAAGEDDVLVEADCVNDGTVTLTSSGVQFVTVCGGTVDMGCTPGQSSCNADESPVRETTLTRDYYMSRTEETQGQFQSLMGYNPSFFVPCSTCPVEQVNWHQAAAFANAMSVASGLSVCYSCTGSGSSVTCSAPSSVYACAGYRLPTEAEWEGAARCGEDLLYAGSNTVGAVAWSASTSGSVTRVVAGLAPNACGLYDMSGNVFEWTNDWDSVAAYSGGAATDPTGAASGSRRVARGGSWIYGPQYARVAFRSSNTTGHTSYNVGLRVARTLP